MQVAAPVPMISGRPLLLAARRKKLRKHRPPRASVGVSAKSAVSSKPFWPGAISILGLKKAAAQKKKETRRVGSRTYTNQASEGARHTRSSETTPLANTNACRRSEKTPALAPCDCRAAPGIDGSPSWAFAALRRPYGSRRPCLRMTSGPSSGPRPAGRPCRGVGSGTLACALTRANPGPRRPAGALRASAPAFLPGAIWQRPM